MRFASFLSGGFITSIVVNTLERILVKRTSVQYTENKTIEKYTMEVPSTKITICMDVIRVSIHVIIFSLGPFFFKSTVRCDKKTLDCLGFSDKKILQIPCRLLVYS